MHSPAESENDCSEIQEDNKKPRKRIIIETKKTTTTTTTTRKELLIDDSNISMSDIQAILDQTDTDAIPAIENIHTNEEINTNVRNTDETEPLFSSTKLSDLQQSSEETQKDLPNTVKPSTEKDTFQTAPKKKLKVSSKRNGTKKLPKVKKENSTQTVLLFESKKAKGSDKNIEQNQSRASSVDQSNKRYPSKKTRATRSTANMAKIAAKKLEKRKSAIDVLVSTYTSMARNPKPTEQIKPSQNVKPQPQTQPPTSHELSAIMENPNETIESLELNEEEPSNHFLLERSWQDDIAEHKTESYVSENAVPIHQDNQKLSCKPKSAGITKKTNKSSRVSKAKMNPSTAKKLKIKEALAKLPDDEDDPLVSVIKRGPLKSISVDKVHSNSRNENKKRRTEAKTDENEEVSVKKPTTKRNRNRAEEPTAMPSSTSIVPHDTECGAELLPDLFEPNDDQIAPEPNISPKKRKSIPKNTNADDRKSGKKSQINAKTFSGNVSNKPMKEKPKVSTATKISLPPSGLRKDRRSRLQKELDLKSITIYSPSRRSNFEAVNGNHVKISKETIEKAITDNCKSSEHLLEQFHPHDIEVEDNTRLLILPGESIRPSKKSDAKMDPLALGRQRRTQTLIIRQRD